MQLVSEVEEEAEEEEEEEEKIMTMTNTTLSEEPTEVELPIPYGKFLTIHCGFLSKIICHTAYCIVGPASSDIFSFLPRKFYWGYEKHTKLR